jgi:pentapeptide MXKDX repeat protein
MSGINPGAACLTGRVARRWHWRIGKLPGFHFNGKDGLTVNKLLGLMVLFCAFAIGFSTMPGCQKTAKKDEKAAGKDEKKSDTPKKDEVKKDEPKKDEVKKDEPKKDEPKKDEPKKDEVKKDLVHQLRLIEMPIVASVSRQNG